MSVPGPDGRQVPVVKSERTLFESTEPEPPAAPPSWIAAYLMAGATIGGLAVGLSGAAASSRFARAGLLLTTWLWWFSSGMAGVVVAGLWGFTDHSAAYYNENVLQTNLLALLLLWFGTRLAFGSQRAATPALVLSAGMAALSILGLLLKALPQFYQVNGEIISLALPAHAGIAAAMWRLARIHDRPTRRAPSRAAG
jgi:hypothetical protein